MITGRRIVTPHRMIHWQRTLWRPKGTPPDWLIPGTVVKVRTSYSSEFVSVRPVADRWMPAVRFVDDATWLPEGF